MQRQNKQAEKLRDVPDEVRWLTNAGYIYLDEGDFSVAEKSFLQSFELARKINGREDIDQLPDRPRFRLRTNRQAGRREALCR